MGQGTTLTALLRGVAERDRDAFAALHATLAPPLWREVVDGGFSAMDADAVIATTFVEVWQLASVHVDNDTQVVDWIRTSIGRRCAERRYRTRGSAPDMGAPPAANLSRQHTAVQYDESAKRAIKELLGGCAPAGRESTDPAPMGQPPYGRLAPAVPVPVPAARVDDPPNTGRRRRADLGAAAAFGHRRSGADRGGRPTR